MKTKKKMGEDFFNYAYTPKYIFNKKERFYSVHDFDVIFIAINVWPFDTILKHLSSQIKKDTRIICRGLNDDLINFIKKGELSDIYSIKAKLQNPKSQSILLIKK